MSYSISFDLKGAIKAKAHRAWLRIIKIRILIPAKSTIET